ncbi:MAG: PilX N-terminal domain-containing pilus assembly protein [Granulosicoccus sp.]
MRRDKVPGHQRGAALMVAMVMIFMMSVLGVSAMRGASLEGQLASNALQKEMTFQAAESATDLILAQDNTLEDIICQPEIIGMNLPSLNQSSSQQTTADLRDGGSTNPIGYSLGGMIGARRFVVTGNSALPDASTQTTIRQGVVLLGASAPEGDC